MSLVQVKDLSVSYGAQKVLSHVSLSVAAGEIVTIVGPNGSGKTSLLRAIIGAVKPIHATLNKHKGSSWDTCHNGFILMKLCQ